MEQSNIKAKLPHGREQWLCPICTGALILTGLLILVYAGFSVVALMTPSEMIATGITDTGMKVGMADWPVNPGKGIPYWAVPRSGITGVLNVVWFWNIWMVVLLEILPVWLILFWLRGYLRDGLPQRAVPAEKRAQNQKKRFWAAGILLILLGVGRRTLWLLLLSGLACGHWELVWNQDMPDVLLTVLGLASLLYAHMQRPVERTEKEA